MKQALFILALLAGTAHAQVQILPLRVGSGEITTPEGWQILDQGRNDASGGQIEIPLHYDGDHAPAGKLIGYGPESVVVATADTDDLPSATRAIVISEGYADAATTSEWQAGSSGGYDDPAVLQMYLGHCTIVGYNSASQTNGGIVTYGWHTDGDVNDVPRTYNQGSATLYDGVRLFGNGGTVEDVTIFGIPGVALDVQRSGSTRNGKQLPMDRLKWNIGPLNVRRVYYGPYIRATDCHAHDIEVESAAQWGIRFGASVMFSRIHCYGVGYSGATGGAAVWFSDENCQGGPIYPENSYIGCRVDGNNTQINGLFSHSCDTNNLQLNAQSATVSNFLLKTTPINVLFAGAQNTLTSGKIFVADSGKAIHLTEGDVQTIQAVNIDGYKSADDTFGESSTGIDVDDALLLTTINANVYNCAKGIDFTGGSIGAGCNINVATSNVTTPVTWPSGQTWNTTPQTTTSIVIINGVRYYQQ